MRRYVEMECPECGAEWEVYCRLEDDGDGGEDLIPVSDEPTGRLGSLACECGADGERI